MPRNRLRTAGRRIAVITAIAVALPGFGGSLFVTPANSQRASSASPSLRLDHIVRTTPFKGSSVSMKDDEGSAYVPRDNSVWLADDNGRMIDEVDVTTGELKRSIDRTDLADVRQLGGGSRAGVNRVRDLESLAYDAANDTLYAFSGSCCTAPVLPTVFRLSRSSGTLELDSYQPLPAGTNFTAAAWNPDDDQLYVSAGNDLRSYDYADNTVGSDSTISNLNGMLGMTFSADGADLFVVRSRTRLSRVDWARRALVPGWTFDLSEFGVRDARAVELVHNQFWVSDGYDLRATSDPLRDAVFVFDIPGSSPVAVTWTGTVASDGYPTRLRASLRTKTRTAIGNQPVTVQMKGYGTDAWKTLGTRLATNPAGTVTYRHHTRRARYFRFSLARSATYQAGTSTAVLVKVPTRLSATAKKGHPDLLRAKLTRAAGSPLAGRKVGLQRRHPGHHTWVTVDRLTTNNHGKATSRQRPRNAYYRWKYTGSTTTRPTHSKSLRLTR